MSDPASIIPAAHQALSGRAFGEQIRGLFPLFASPPGSTYAYLDSASSAQKPALVIERMSSYLGTEHANIHRGAYALSAKATELYEQARARVAAFIGAKTPNEIVFTRGTTESINLVASAGESLFKANDAILLTIFEHHSNIVPWQLLAKRRGLKIEFAGATAQFELDYDDLAARARRLRPQLMAVTQTSNALGTIIDIPRISELAREVGSLLLVDVAQSVVHVPVDVQALGADFVVFSGHKLYGPTGSGVLWGRAELLERLAPYQAGGGMIESVTTSGSTFASPPHRFEAGTPAIAEAIGLATAIDFVEAVGRSRTGQHEAALVEQCVAMLQAEAGVSIYGPAIFGQPQEAIVSFNLAGVHAHDLATIADSCGVQLRAGHHCAMPLLASLGLSSTARVSFAMYNTGDDILKLKEAVAKARRIFA